MRTLIRTAYQDILKCLAYYSLCFLLLTLVKICYYLESPSYHSCSTEKTIFPIWKSRWRLLILPFFVHFLLSTADASDAIFGFTEHITIERKRLSNGCDQVVCRCELLWMGYLHGILSCIKYLYWGLYYHYIIQAKLRRCTPSTLNRTWPQTPIR